MCVSSSVRTSRSVRPRSRSPLSSTGRHDVGPGSISVTPSAPCRIAVAITRGLPRNCRSMKSALTRGTTASSMRLGVAAVGRRRQEHLAVVEIAAVDVQRDRRARRPRVGEDVMIGRRNQAAGGAGAGQQRSDRRDAIVAVGFLLHEVLRHRDLAVDHAFDAPQAAVIVDGGALSRSPRHDDRRVTALRIAMQQAPRVRIGTRLHEAAGQRQLAARRASSSRSAFTAAVIACGDPASTDRSSRAISSARPGHAAVRCHHFFRFVSNSFRMRLYSSAQLVASTKP